MSSALPPNSDIGTRSALRIVEEATSQLCHEMKERPPTEAALLRFRCDLDFEN
jgi:hypothetical protein